jgi:predicted phosphoribosyltransferase
MIFHRFHDRVEAGHELAKSLFRYANRKDVIVLALPRGGVPVADAIARELSLPMDVWLVRKLGVPGQEELAMGALSMGGICHIEPEITAGLNIPKHIIQETIVREARELERRNTLYRHDKPLPDLKGKTAIVVDDGLATGATMRAAVLSLRKANAKRIVVAVPVGAETSCRALRDIADELVCPRIPEHFYGVGQWYENFPQTSDAEVLEFLNRSNETEKRAQA